MFLCECNVWIDCSFIGRSWDSYTGTNTIIWSDCPKQCKKVCSASPVPTVKQWAYYNNLLETKPLQFQPINAEIVSMGTNWNAVSSSSVNIGTVTDNRIQWRR